MRTIILKLHKPSKLKQKILDNALLNYNRAYQYLLSKAYLDLENIKNNYRSNKGSYKADTLSKWVGKELSSELNEFHVQPFKDSLKLDLGMTLAGYFMLKSRIPSARFPGGEPTIHSIDPENVSSGKLRPVYFCRYDTKRSYCLLYDKLKDKYYAKLYLTDYSCARPVRDQHDILNRLRYIHKDSRLLERGKAKETFILVPLSFGTYQEEFLKAAIVDPARLRTAKLYKKKQDYYLAVSLDTNEVRKLNTETFLGVARGIKNKLNYAIVNDKNQILGKGSISDTSNCIDSAIVPLNELHRAANEIISIALSFKSQVVLQNLSDTNDNITWLGRDGKNFPPSYKSHNYNKLSELLEYKLVENGLPAPVRVSSIDIFYRCHECGYNSKQNRLTKDIFLCTKCGATMSIDDLGSLNLAGKLIKYNNSKFKIKVIRTSDGVIFRNKLLCLDYYIPYSEDQLERLSEELQRIAEAIKNSLNDTQGSDRKRKLSLIKKLNNSEHILDLIEFI